jgi:hypothetical protein
MDACSHSRLHGHTFRHTNVFTNGSAQARMPKSKLARKYAEASGNLDRGNVAPTLQRRSTCTAASWNLSSIFGAFVQHFLFTCGEASWHLRMDDWEPVQKPKGPCAATSKKLRFTVCTAVQNRQSTFAGSSHIHSSVRTPALQCRAPAEQSG